jgi:DNA-binding transcriptional regulator YiaG
MEIRNLIQKYKLRQWEIAEIIGVSEFTLSRWLRRPDNLSQEQESKIFTAINHLLKKEA